MPWLRTVPGMGRMYGMRGITSGAWKRAISGAAALAFLISGTCLAQVSAPPVQGVKTLRTTRAVRLLAAGKAGEGYPVKFQAVVLYYDPNINSHNGTLFVHDRTGGIFVALPARPVLPLHEGDLIEVSGVSGAGEFAPVVARPQIRVLGQSHPPSQARLLTLSQLMSGAYDSQWVELEGTVHSVLPHGYNMVVRLATNEGPISATTIKAENVDYDRLIDAKVRLRAVAASQFNQRRQLTGVHLFFPSLDTMDVEHYGPPDPFSLPLRSVSQVSRFEAGKVTFDRIHLRGSVTLQWPGRFVCIEDASGGLCVQTADKTDFPVGSLVDVIGFPAIAEATPILTDATLRRVGVGSLRQNYDPISARDAMQGIHSGELVAIEGEVVGRNLDPREPAVVIASDGLVFPAVLPPGAAAASLAQWETGSKVRVFGICSALTDSRESDDRQGPARFDSFRILMRSGQDLTILAKPSWWTPRHTIAVLSVALVITLAVLGWAVILHRRVEHQTQLVSESEERFRHLAHHDSLTGLPNRALLHIRLDEAIERAKRDHTCLALLMMDLDRFKQVNDSLGHDGGDQMLCEAARRITSAVRRSDTVARMGGDEFIVLLSGLCDVSEACEIAVKTLHSVSEPLMIGIHCIPISASIGVCAFPDDGLDASALLKNADTAMYQAKALGRNRFHRYMQQQPTEDYSSSFVLQAVSSGD